MRIEKHQFTPVTSREGGKISKNLTSTFAERAPIHRASRSLKGRVAKPKSVTERGHQLSKEVGKILKTIRTPFLVHSQDS